MNKKNRKKTTDTQMLEWVMAQGWVALVRRRIVKPFRNDTFILSMNSRERIMRAMGDRVDDPSRSSRMRWARKFEEWAAAERAKIGEGA